MNPLESLGKTLLLLAGLVALLGAGLWVASRLGAPPRLPGDLRVRRGNWTVYAPFGWMILLSLLLTVAFSLYARFRR